MSTISEFDALWQEQAEAMEEQFGKPFLYRRGVLTCEILASLGSHEIEADPDAGIVNAWHGHKFVTEAAGLILAGQTITPQRGDQILEPLAGNLFDIYEVVPLPKAKEYEPLDAEGFQVAIYTQLLRSSAVLWATPTSGNC